MAKSSIPILSLFSGAGGLDLGFHQAHFKTVLAIDSEQVAVETYNRNRKSDTAVQLDLSKNKPGYIINLIKSTTSEIPQGIIGGPPCQGFSRGNIHKNPRETSAIICRTGMPTFWQNLIENIGYVFLYLKM
jgi:DNA (cytosine-5)-methyltransferase 1